MIRIEHLSKTYGEGTATQVEALRDVTLEIASGEFVVVIGTNGSGKSTLLNMIAGTSRPDRGRILIDDIDVTRMEAHARAAYIGRVFQNPTVGTAPAMTVAENLRMADLRGVRKGLRIGLNRAERERLRERARELGMGLEDRLDTPMGSLSGGQRQALTLLMATLRRPRILLLDEHTAALDPRSAEQVLELTRRVIALHGLTALMVTHDMTEAVANGTRLLMMHGGAATYDVAGAEKRGLTAAMLLNRFEQARIGETGRLRD